MLGLRGPLEFIKLNQVRIYGSVLVARAAQSFHYGKCASEDMGVVSRVERGRRISCRLVCELLDARLRRHGSLVLVESRSVVGPPTRPHDESVCTCNYILVIVETQFRPIEPVLLSVPYRSLYILEPTLLT